MFQSLSIVTFNLFNSSKANQWLPKVEGLVDVIMKKVILSTLMILFVANAAIAGETMKNVHSFSAKTIDQKEKSLSDFKGKALLIVNTASKCGFTPQYKSLEALYKKYKAKGFEILAFPANNFMGQEPGTNEEIKKFCELNYHVSFPLFSKISVKGKDIDPLYQYLTKESGFDGDISWNFNKFLINPEGQVTARFGSKTDPLSSELVGALEQVLPSQ